MTNHAAHLRRLPLMLLAALSIAGCAMETEDETVDDFANASGSLAISFEAPKKRDYKHFVLGTLELNAGESYLGGGTALAIFLKGRDYTSLRGRTTISCTTGNRSLYWDNPGASPVVACPNKGRYTSAKVSIAYDY